MKRGDTRLAVKAGAWYVISSFLVKGMAFITTPIFSRIMSQSDYGEFSNFASWLATLLIIASAELYNTISRAYYDYIDDFDSYVSTVTIASCGFTVILYVLAIIFKDFVLNIIALPEKYIHILFVTLLCQCCKQSFMARERTLYRYKSVAMMSIINLVIPTLIALVLVLLLPDDQRLSGRIYGFYLPSSAIGLACGTVIIRRYRGFRWEQCKYALKLSVPMLVHYLTAYILTSSNVIVTKKMLGAASSAIVSISSSTIHILTIFFQSLSGAITTWVMDNLKQDNRTKLRRDSLFYVAGLTLVAIGVVLLAPEVVWILGGTKYTDAIRLIPGQVVAVLVQSVTSLLTIILTYDKNIAKTAVFTGIVSVFSVTVKILLLPKYGINILPYINLAAFSVLFIVNYLLVRKAGYANAINVKGIAVILLVAVVFMELSSVLYRHKLVRYVVISIVMVFGFIVIIKNKDTIKQLLKSRKKKNLTGTTDTSK